MPGRQAEQPLQDNHHIQHLYCCCNPALPGQWLHQQNPSSAHMCVVSRKMEVEVQEMLTVCACWACCVMSSNAGAGPSGGFPSSLPQPPGGMYGPGGEPPRGSPGGLGSIPPGSGLADMPGAASSPLRQLHLRLLSSAYCIGLQPAALTLCHRLVMSVMGSKPSSVLCASACARLCADGVRVAAYV